MNTKYSSPFHQSSLFHHQTQTSTFLKLKKQVTESMSRLQVDVLYYIIHRRRKEEREKERKKERKEERKKDTVE